MAGSDKVGVGLFGGFRLLIGGRGRAQIPSVRQQQLIAFLVLHARNAAVARQRIAGSLWPESSNSQALTNLRPRAAAASKDTTSTMPSSLRQVSVRVPLSISASVALPAEHWNQLVVWFRRRVFGWSLFIV